MAKYSFKYGDSNIDFEYPQEDVIKVLEPNKVDFPDLTEEEIIKNAIENPIGSPKLEEIVKAGQTVCILEAMKLMNEIESDFDCEIEAVLVSNEQRVEYGQPLFKVKKLDD